MSETRPAAAAAPGTMPPLPGKFAWEPFTPLLCLAGLAIAAYLTVMHFGLLTGDVSLGEACGPGGDCNSVVSSRYGKLFGLPVSAWGMCYYLVAGVLSTATLLLRREDGAPFVRATLRLTLLALAFDAYLAWAMTTRVGRVCPLCVATWAINVLIFVLTVPVARAVRGLPDGFRPLLPSMAGLRRPAESEYYREVLKLILTGLGAGASVLTLALSLTLSRSILQAQVAELAGLLQFLVREAPVAIPAEDLPARGSKRAPISIVVFSDFMCEQCKRASRYFDIVAANHRETLRIAYVSYPSDKTCNPHADQSLHPGACTLARAAACARRQGRFWEFHDAVFADPGKVGPEKLDSYAVRSGLDTTALRACLAEGDSAAGLPAEIALGRSVGVHATPTSFINGRPVVGALKPWMLEAAIEVLARRP